MASKKQVQQRTDMLLPFDPAVEPVVEQRDVKARKEAARWLGVKGDRTAVVPLISALQDSSWKVRRNAAVSLGKLKAIEAVDPLIGALSDRTISVKRAATRALGTLRDARATPGLVALLGNRELSGDAQKALIRIGAPALLHRCRQMNASNAHTRVLRRKTPEQIALQGTDPDWRELVYQMLLQQADLLPKEMLRLEGWSGPERYLALETVRSVQSSLSFFAIWQLPKFSRITDIASWCERVVHDAELSALHVGARQVLDYLMLGRASQRDYAAESEELLRGISGTQVRDTGETLLRASEEKDGASQAPAHVGPVRRWLGILTNWVRRD